jgi:hypothetical protein
MKEEQENEELDPYTETAMMIEAKKVKEMVR